MQSAIQNQVDKDYTLEVRLETVFVDDSETERVRNLYLGSQLADARGWTDDILLNHFIVIIARYHVRYDHTKTFLDDGYLEQYFYLVHDPKSNNWTIADNTAPNQLS